MFQQPFPYTCCALTPAPWHGAPPDWQRKELPLQEKPSSKFVFVCIGTERAVHEIVFITAIVNHAKELLIDKDLYLRTLFSGHRRTSVTVYGF